MLVCRPTQILQVHNLFSISRTQPDFKSEWDNSSINGADNIRSLLVEKYNSEALALFLDKVACESDGRKWDEYSSSVQS